MTQTLTQDVLELNQNVVTPITVLDGMTQPDDIVAVLTRPDLSTLTVKLSDGTDLDPVELGRLYHFSWLADQEGEYLIDVSFEDPLDRVTWRSRRCVEIRQGSC